MQIKDCQVGGKTKKDAEGITELPSGKQAP
jgi:hypothetical protein